MDKLAYIKRYATNAHNPKGYVINALRQDISELKEKEKDKINEVAQKLASKKKV